MHVSFFLRCSEQIPGRILLSRGGGNVKGRPCGSLAQLAECSHDKQDALGSSPGRATILPPFYISSESAKTLHFQWKIFSFRLHVTYHTSCICPSDPLRFKSRFHQGDKINDECVLIDTEGN